MIDLKRELQETMFGNINSTAVWKIVVSLSRIISAAFLCLILVLVLSIPAIIRTTHLIDVRKTATHGTLGSLPSTLKESAQRGRQQSSCYTFKPHRDVMNDANEYRRGLVSVGVGAKPLYYALYLTTALCGVWIVGDSPHGDAWIRGGGDTTCGLGTDVVWLGGAMPIVTATVRRVRSWVDLENCSKYGAGPMVARAIAEAERYQQCVGILGLCGNAWPPSRLNVHELPWTTYSEATCGSLTVCTAQVRPDNDVRKRAFETEESAVTFSSKSMIGFSILDAVQRGYTMNTGWWRVAACDRLDSTEVRRIAHRSNADVMHIIERDYAIPLSLPGCDGIADIFDIVMPPRDSVHLHRFESRIVAAFIDPMSQFRHTESELRHLYNAISTCRQRNNTCERDSLLYDLPNVTRVPSRRSKSNVMPSRLVLEDDVPSAYCGTGTYSVFQSTVSNDDDSREMLLVIKRLGVQCNRWDFAIGAMFIIASIPIAVVTFGGMIMSSASGTAVVCITQISAWYVILADSMLTDPATKSAETYVDELYGGIAHVRTTSHILNTYSLADSLAERPNIVAFGSTRIVACIMCYIATAIALYKSRKSCMTSILRAKASNVQIPATDGSMEMEKYIVTRYCTFDSEKSLNWWRKSAITWSCSLLLIAISPIVSIYASAAPLVIGMAYAIAACVPLFALLINTVTTQKRNHSGYHNFVERCVATVLAGAVAITVCTVSESDEFKLLFNLLVYLLGTSPTEMEMVVWCIVIIVTVFLAVPALVMAIVVVIDPFSENNITMADIAGAASLSESHAAWINKMSSKSTSCEEHPNINLLLRGTFDDTSVSDAYPYTGIMSTGATLHHES